MKKEEYLLRVRTRLACLLEDELEKEIKALDDSV